MVIYRGVPALPLASGFQDPFEGSRANDDTKSARGLKHAPCEPGNSAHRFEQPRNRGRLGTSAAIARGGSAFQ